MLVPALPVLALLIYWDAHEGGYLSTTWMPSALVVLGLLVATVLGIGVDRVRLSKPAVIALGALAAYTAWSYLSILWAAAPGDALEGSDRTLLYLMLFALFALLPWRAGTLLAALSVLALGIGAIALDQLLRLGDAGDVAGMFSGGRLKAPLGYPNGAAALFMTGTLLSTALAARRELPAVLRGLLLAAAALSLQTTILCESRGWLFALPVMVVLTLLVVPGRVRLALWALPVALAALLPLRTLLDVFARPDGAADPSDKLRALVDAAENAHGAMLPIVVAVFVLGTLLALLDRRVRVTERTAGRVNALALALAAVVAIGGVVAGFALTDGRPDRKLSDYWERSNGYQATVKGESRFGAVGSNRPDFWRVSLDALAAHPLTGLGQDDWSDYYLVHRRSDEQPRWTHSLQLRLLAHTGIIGTLLFAVFLVAALLGALRSRRRAGPAAAAAAIALLPLVVWFVHGSIDWFWEFPALSGATFALLGAATAVMTPAQQADAAPRDAAPAPAGDTAAPAAPADATDAASAPARPRASRGVRIGATAAVAVAAVAALLALALPFAAERETVDASNNWVENPAAALRKLDNAADLNPLSARAPLVAGVIALEADRPRVARTRFAQAAERAPEDWFARFGLALSATALGEREVAARELAAAHARNPRDPLIAEAQERIDSRRPVTVAEAFTRLREGVSTLTSTF